MEVKMGHKILYYLEEIDNLVKGFDQFPVTCEIDVSNRCQNNCNFCIYADYIKSERVDLSYDIYQDLLYSLQNIGVKSITFTGGGEPLMNENFKSMVNFAHHSGFELGLVTNGIYLNRIMDILGIFRFIRVSLDAATAGTYKILKGTSVFKHLKRIIELIVEKNETDVGISMVITEDNRYEIDKFKRLGKDLGVGYIQLKSAWKPNNIEDTMKGIAEKDVFLTERYTVDQKSLTACKIAGLIGQVAANGKVYYCCVHRGKKEFEIGDLKKETFKRIMTKRYLFSPNLSKCGSCRYMNYAKIYEQVRDKKYLIMRHKRFI